MTPNNCQRVFEVKTKNITKSLTVSQSYEEIDKFHFCDVF
jgi:hypothetical protein